MMDSNGPGKVSGYFYLGTTKPTEDNYKTLPGAVTTYTSINEAVGATASVAVGETLYMLCPAAWMEGKTVELEDDSENIHYFSEDIDPHVGVVTITHSTVALNLPLNKSAPFSQ